MRYFATVPFAMEKTAQAELRAFGIENSEIGQGRVYFEANFKQLAEILVGIRSVDRVFLEVAVFGAMSFDELFDQVAAIKWQEIISKNGRINVSASCARSQLMSVPDVQRISKKAIVTALEKKYGSCPETGEEYPVNIQINRDNVCVAVDCCGCGLHKRGYRIKNAAAPLRETFAAGLLLLSRYNGEDTFMDPFCGSGTLAIEAAMIALNMAPGVNRDFVCEDWQNYDKSAFALARQAATDNVRPHSIEVYCSDISPEMTDMTRFHAHRAGVEQYIKVRTCSVEKVIRPCETGVLVANPPYGQRLGDEKSMRELGLLIKEGMKTLDGWKMNFLSGNNTFERLVGRRADKTRRLYNGNIECNLYTYFPKR